VPDLAVVQPRLPLAKARRRAALRVVHLTDEEFDALHAQQLARLAVDERLEVASMTLEQQAAAVTHLWDRL
jgi:hypothetical protein